MNKKEKYRKILDFYFTDYISNAPRHERNKFVASGFFGFLRSIAITLYLNSKRNRKVDQRATNFAGKKWVFIIGKNNYEATSFLAEAGFVFTTERIRPFTHEFPVFELPVRIFFKAYFWYPPLFLYLLKHEGRRIFSVADAVFASLGWLEAFEKIIDDFKPSVIVFSNDHSLVPRALFFAAKAKKVPTIYIQHASISRYMPKLEFDLSLLEGRDALNKYAKKGVSGKVKLVGMPRFDVYSKFRKFEGFHNVRTVGIAFNTIDSLERVREITNSLIASNMERLIIRAHPKDTRNFKEILDIINPRVEFSDSKDETAFDFILRSDIIIAGDSSIHLESKMLNVDSMYYQFSDSAKMYDFYGYIETGFVIEYKTSNEITTAIKNAHFNPNLYKQCAYYNEAVSHGTAASDLAKTEIELFLTA